MVRVGVSGLQEREQGQPVEPLFRRPTRGDALALARKEFLAGERVDMQVLAARLNVGRTTLYRWVGDREQLLGEMLSELAKELLARTATQATGTGLDRFLASIRSYLELCIGSAAFQTFLDRELEIALRLVMSRRSPLFRRTSPCEDDVQMLCLVGEPDLVRGSLAERETRYLNGLRRFPASLDPTAPDRAERISPLAVVPETIMRGYYRQATGPGWALVGDAGHLKHPSNGQGIGDAIEQAYHLAGLLTTGEDVTEFQRWRDEYFRDHDMWSFRMGPSVTPTAHRRCSPDSPRTRSSHNSGGTCRPSGTGRAQ